MFSVRYGSQWFVWGCYPTHAEAAREACSLARCGYTAVVNGPRGELLNTYRPAPMHAGAGVPAR